MKKTTLFRLLISVFGVASITALGASAQALWMGDQDPVDIATRQQERFSQEAELLGISTDVVKDGWAQGKSLDEIAKEQGIDEEELRSRIQQKHQEQMQSHLRVLVDQGVLTQAQADQRIESVQDMIGSGQQAPRFGRMGGPMFGSWHGTP
jgi:hypothetical protein